MAFAKLVFSLSPLAPVISPAVRQQPGVPEMQDLAMESTEKQHGQTIPATPVKALTSDIVDAVEVGCASASIAAKYSVLSVC